MKKSTRKRSRRKPRNGFPLTRHPRGYWCKKVKGKLYYFGRIADDPDGTAALQQWVDSKDEILAGRVPKGRRAGLTIADLINTFCNWKRELVEAGELSPKTLKEYVDTGKRIVHALGRNRLVSDLKAEDFQTFRASLAKAFGPVRLGNTIQRVRIIFKYAYDAELIKEPVRFGPAFKGPSAKVLRQARIERGPRMFSAEELRVVLEHASTNVKAMVLLGINGGLGNLDVAELPVAALDLDGGWLDYPRGKTAVNRRIPLWPETVAAIRESLDQRPDPATPEDSKLVFLNGNRRGYAAGGYSDRVQRELKRVTEAAAVVGRTFYDLRRTFETIAGETLDQVAVDAIMGHAPKHDDMAAVYRQKVSDERLRAVVDFVRAWLFPPDVDKDDQKDDEQPATLKFPAAG